MIDFQTAPQCLEAFCPYLLLCRIRASSDVRKAWVALPTDRSLEVCHYEQIMDCVLCKVTLASLDQLLSKREIVASDFGRGAICHSIADYWSQHRGEFHFSRVTDLSQSAKELIDLLCLHRNLVLRADAFDTQLWLVWCEHLLCSASLVERRFALSLNTAGGESDRINCLWELASGHFCFSEALQHDIVRCLAQNALDPSEQPTVRRLSLYACAMQTKTSVVPAELSVPLKQDELEFAAQFCSKI